MTAPERSSRWSRRFVFAGATLLVCWQVVELAGLARQTGVVLGLLGFVFHTIFGKAYSLVPTYFDRDLATTRLMPVHLACSLSGTVLLAADAELSRDALGTAGAILWAGGVLLFLGTIGWTIRDNLAGAETATGEHSADRRAVDRAANLFVPVALTYLAVGSYELLAIESALPVLFDGYAPRATHLLAVGGGALVVFAVGFRLLPRFLVASPPRPLVAVVLPAGAVGPALLAWGLPAGDLFRVGAVVQATAVAGFAVAFWVLYARSERRRVGFYGVLAATVAGLVGVALGLLFAFDAPTADLVTAHRRMNVLGFLGLAIVGVSYQFYPPAVADFLADGDRAALVILVALAGGLALEVGGLVTGVEPVTVVGLTIGTAGALAHAGVLAGLFRQQYG
jgi:hypothetical protein